MSLRNQTTSKKQEDGNTQWINMIQMHKGCIVIVYLAKLGASYT